MTGWMWGGWMAFHRREDTDDRRKHTVPTWMVPTSSALSSGFVPMKSKERQRVASPSACSAIFTSC